MTLKTTMLLTLTALFASTCPTQPATTPPAKEDLAAVVDGSNSFATDLYAKLAADKKGNLFFSPSSIHTALAMTYAGAAGNTADQMAKTMHFTLPADRLSVAFADLNKKLQAPKTWPFYDRASNEDVRLPVYELTVANSLWGQKGYAFKPAFTQLLQKSYGAGLEEVDFGQPDTARKTINDWVAQRTKDKVTAILPEGGVNAKTRLVLANAVYFKSKWQEQFPKEATKDGQFMMDGTNAVTVPLMHLEWQFGYMATNDYQMLELPYFLDELSLVVILPTKTDGVVGVGNKLKAADIAGWLKDRKSTLVNVTLPKFKFSSEFKLADTLTDMGIREAFDPAKADFTGMTNNERLFISEVFHKAFIAVDEEGTEAAAATAIPVEGEDMQLDPPKPVQFKADHPFIFMIRHNATGEILFMGRLANPKGE